ncbi:amidase signature domain-containing protein [Apiosordaria backusii]|uniref:Amidase signature domain-containing protein n=1 Tax=Apiosordaria backusii TaxID=314023 RepID=A0AA40DV06_9PEZI|nr:amidase signature domain-containing protein [Apiosordaria backusii]
MQRIQFSQGGVTFVTDTAPSGYLTKLDGKLEERSGPVVIHVVDQNAVDWNVKLDKEKDRMLEFDDVINEDFFQHVALCQIPNASSKTKTSRLTHEISTPGIDNARLHSGPYYFQNSGIYKVYRLYQDTHRAFMFGVTRNKTETTSPTFQEYPGSLIPVPSRLYYDPPTDEFPLRGKRVAVKDVYHLAGTPTSASSRDYQAISGIVDGTSEMVLRLIKAGAVIVGKTKTAQFASGERAGDWVDYPCPFNPRGDGYLDPDGSSTGSAAAVAGYSWLDYAIGTDTLGSMVCPAASQGVFGIRPTHGISVLDGIVPVSKHLDTAGFFSRSITEFKVFGKAWYTDQRDIQYDRLLYAREHFDEYPEDSRKRLEAFVQDVEKFIQQTRVDFNVSADWAAKAEAPNNVPLDEFLATTLAHIQLFGSYHNNLPFREAFNRAHSREPYANPMVRFKWNLGAKVTDEQFLAALQQQALYRNFLRQHVFGDNTILVLPAGDPEPLYRDVYHGPPEKSGYSLQRFGFCRDLYSFLGGLPQVVVPIGTVSHISPVTKARVEVPLSVSIFGPEGSDCALIDFVEKVLIKSGRPLGVLAGPDLFPTPST